MNSETTPIQENAETVVNNGSHVQDMYEAKQFLSKMLHLAATGYGKLSSRQAPLKKKIEEFLDGKRPANIGGRKYYYQELLDIIFDE